VSNQDSFIDEVTEEVRRDKLFALMRRYGWIAITLVIVLVGGAAFNEFRKSQIRAEAEATGDAILAALAAEDPDARATAIAALPPGDNAGRTALLALLSAAAQEQAGDRAAATKTLEDLAANTAVPASYRDLATLKAMILGADQIAPEERIARLNGLALSGGPYRLMAMEQVALAQIETGETDAAISTLRDILADAQVSQDLRRRASQLIVALGGTLTAA
jgi:hypothetical protein